MVRDVDEAPAAWEKRVSLLEEVYRFLEAGMKQGTGVLAIKDSDPTIADLWEKFSTGAINIDELKGRFALFKPVLDAHRIHRP